MTPSDRDPNAPGPANPFDTGLPMLRMPPPAASKSKRKRKRQAGRVIGRNVGAARAEPGVIDSAGTADEPIPPLPVPERSRPSGDWAQWLEPRSTSARPPARAWAGSRVPTDTGASAAKPSPDRDYRDSDGNIDGDRGSGASADVHRGAGGTAYPDVGGDADGDRGSGAGAYDDRGAGGEADDDRDADAGAYDNRESGVGYGSGEFGGDASDAHGFGASPYADRGDSENRYDGDAFGDAGAFQREATVRDCEEYDLGDEPPARGAGRGGAADPDSSGADVADRRFDRKYAAANIFDEAGPDEPKRLPSLIDRTGGNPGPSLRRPRPQGADSGSGNDRLPAVLVVVGVLIAVGSIVWALLPGAPPVQQAEAPVEQATPPPAPTTTVAPEVTAVATPGCEQRNSADVVSGTQPGGTTDGPSAILAFEHAYYVLRSGAAARAVVTPDSTVPAADQIQRGIDQVPVGTRYCVHITKLQAPSADGLTRWEVRLTQQYPDEQPKTFLQSIATRSHTGKTLIASISMA